MARSEVSTPLKYRSIERDIILLFPIIELILGVYAAMAMFNVANPSYQWIGSDIFIKNSASDWFLILTIGAIIGFLSRRNLYLYYTVVSVPLQILAIRLLQFSIVGCSYGAGEVAILLLVISIASAVFAGKIIPSNKLWTI